MAGGVIYKIISYFTAPRMHNTHAYILLSSPLCPLSIKASAEPHQIPTSFFIPAAPPQKESIRFAAFVELKGAEWRCSLSEAAARNLFYRYTYIFHPTFLLVKTISVIKHF